MIGAIKKEENLAPFLKESCEENNYSAGIDPAIKKSDFVIIKVDDYYNAQRMENTPASVDCLVVVKSSDGSFSVYLVELKNVRRAGTINIDNVYEKFKNTLNLFMSQIYQKIFFEEKHEINKVHLYFVADPYRWKNKNFSEEKIKSKLKETKLEKLLLKKPLRFRGKAYQIAYKLPNPLIRKE